jgi:hypothetical protein
MIDADGSTQPEEIPAFVEALVNGHDFVKGSRFMKGGGTADMSFLRMAGNFGFTWLTRLFFRGRYTDLCYGYNAFWRRVVPMLELDGTGFEIETMMNIRALRAGLRVTEVPSFEAERIHGESNLRTFPDGWRVLKTIFRERFKAQPLALAPRGEEPLRPAIAVPVRPAHGLVAVPVEESAELVHASSAAPSEIIAAR